MIVERWNPEKHLPLVRLWADLHSIKGDVTAAMFPALGIVVGNIAAGFLDNTEAGVDTLKALVKLVGNPKPNLMVNA